ncbi:hypothetical protein N8I77_006774 [Diaporthe amygdali]|uniref:Uncharacterized protein n=1 Tax=Phomopsis amygdali TaxID=1214568 RepID=A0AAD9SHD5_PHOAM|nr:hypothetical protein N8I77_006774 [Diaporthe amygdali]
MSTLFSIRGGVLGLLSMDYTAFAPFTTTARGLTIPKERRIHEDSAYFRIFLGVDDGDLGHSGGELPDVHMFNYYGVKTGGVSDPGEWVAPGSSAILWAGGEGKWEGHAPQPIYTLFTANNDAICVALATTAFPGLTGHYAWSGDWGSECAGDNTTIGTWYFSGVVIPGTNYYPNCLWIDRNGGQPATAFQVNWVDLKPGEDDSRIGKSPHDMCQTPSFNIFQSHDPTGIIYEKQETDDHGVPLSYSKPATSRENARTRRSVAVAKFRFEQKWSNVLVVDDLPAHSAHTLCESSSSAGPSFVNEEDGYFCDMETRTVYPVCKQQSHTDVCFDTEQNDLGELPNCDICYVSEW